MTFVSGAELRLLRALADASEKSISAVVHEQLVRSLRDCGVPTPESWE